MDLDNLFDAFDEEGNDGRQNNDSTLNEMEIEMEKVRKMAAKGKRKSSERTIDKVKENEIDEGGSQGTKIEGEEENNERERKRQKKADERDTQEEKDLISNSIFQMDNGEILVTVMGQDVFAPGKIYRLVKNEDVPEPPSRLSELGVFADLNTLEPAAGLIEYEVNSPLWSDRAVKKRWLAIPNDGFFSDENRVRFSRSGEWTFPPGTVFVKQFDLPKSIDSCFVQFSCSSVFAD